MKPWFLGLGAILAMLTGPLVATGCSGLSSRDKEKIISAATECKGRIDHLRLDESFFAENRIDGNEEFPPDLLKKSIDNITAALDSFKGAGNSFGAFNGGVDKDLQAKMERHTKLMKFSEAKASAISDTLQSCFIGQIAPIIKKSSKDWQELSGLYLPAQTGVLGSAIVEIKKTSDIRQNINRAADRANAFLDQVLSKARS
jgi:hypothetical protein